MSLGRVLRVIVPASGFVVGGMFVLVGFQAGALGFPGGDIVAHFAPAGVAFRSGTNAYQLSAEGMPFFYAPPWAAAFAIFPSAATIGIAILGANVLALRYMAGSWLAIGYLWWFPLLPWETFGGSLNILMAASIVAACRDVTWPAVVMGLAKLSPALAISPRAWRTALLVVTGCLILTLPRLDLWPLWFERLWWAMSHPVGPLIPVSFVVRLAGGLALVAWRRPWSRALGAVIVTPAFYYESLVLFVAPVIVAWEGRRR